jgi:hypothetical protein
MVTVLGQYFCALLMFILHLLRPYEWYFSVKSNTYLCLWLYKSFDAQKHRGAANIR